MKLDPVQRTILNLLQKDSTLSTQVLSERVGMSATPCWRRVREMEEAGVISATWHSSIGIRSGSAPVYGCG